MPIRCVCVCLRVCVLCVCDTPHVLIVRADCVRKGGWEVRDFVIIIFTTAFSIYDLTPAMLSCLPHNYENTLKTALGAPLAL